MRQTYRRVVTSFWTDSDVRRIARKSGHPIEARLLLAYLFTGPDSKLSGLYFQEPDLMASRTGIPLDVVEALLELFEGEFLFYDHRTFEVFVRREWHHQVGPEAKPKDNRWKGLIRSILDAESDELVARIVAEYPDFPWPEEVTERAGGASKGLPSNDDGPPGGVSTTPEARGSEVSHAHAHTHALPIDTINPHCGEAAKSEAIESRPQLTVSAGGKDESDSIWLEVKRVAYEALGLRKLSYRDERANAAILRSWQHTQPRDPGSALEAVWGMCLLREDGVFSEWTDPIHPGDPVSLKPLVSSGVLVDVGDGETARNLWTASIDRYRQELNRREGADQARRRNFGGLSRINVSGVL